MFGWMGVDLFFVLSGFLITGILVDTKNERGYYRTFIMRRVLRIFPIYYAVLIVFSFIAPFFKPTSWFTEYQVYFWTYTCNYLFLKHGFFWPLGHFWSLAIEEQFYLLWPIVIYFLKPKQVALLSLSLIILSVCLRLTIENKYLSYGLPIAHLDGLSIGAIISIFYRSHKEIFFKYSREILITSSIVFLIFLCYGVFKNTNLNENPLSITIASAFFGSVLIGGMSMNKIAKILSFDFLVFFGKYSYGMYIFNSIFFHFSNLVFARNLPVYQRLLTYFGVFLLTIIASYLSYNLLEIKFIRLKERLSYS